MTQALGVGIAGLGTVGVGTFKLITEQEQMITARAGRMVEVVSVASRSQNKERGIDTSNLTWHTNTIDIASDDNVDVVVEAIGGDEGIAKELCEAALRGGKHVVTANKALIAKHGLELAELAANNNVSLLFEAAVAGGIPVLKCLKEGLAANQITKIAGIMNGTCNYILTTMKDAKRDFEDVLKEAQDLGYAEADPSFDVDGVDTAHKLSILASLGFGAKLSFDDVHIEGIRDIAIEDIEQADRWGYKIKLLGICKHKAGSIEQAVYPAMIPNHYPIASIDGVDNAIFIESNAVGKSVLVGPGAGSLPTGSSVVADIIDIAAGRAGKPFNCDIDQLKAAKFSSIDQHEGSYYLRLTVKDEAGVLAKLTDILQSKGISLESVGQNPIKDKDAVHVVGMTHVTSESVIAGAKVDLAAIDAVLEPVCVIRIER